MSAYQERKYAEEVVKLAEKGESIDWMVDIMQTDIHSGIDDSPHALAQRKERFGNNEKEKREPPGMCHYIWASLDDFTLKILLASAVISIVLSTSTADAEDRKIAWIDGFGILLAVFICVTVSSVNDYQRDRQFLDLNSVADDRKTVTVVRSGKKVEIHEDHLLIGDVLVIA